MAVKLDFEAVLRQVRANRAKLKACEGPHDFVVAIDGKPIGRKAVCSKCAGSVSSIEANWYKEGLEHGKRAPTEAQHGSG